MVTTIVIIGEKRQMFQYSKIMVLSKLVSIENTSTQDFIKTKLRQPSVLWQIVGGLWSFYPSHDGDGDVVKHGSDHHGNCLWILSNDLPRTVFGQQHSSDHSTHNQDMGQTNDDQQLMTQHHRSHQSQLNHVYMN